MAISYSAVVLFISVLWLVVRGAAACKNKKMDLKRELQLFLVYICFIVVARFAFFPFAKADGHIQPLIWDFTHILPFRLNLIPFVNLLDYEIRSEAVINVVGNTTMFIPIGVIYPAVYKKLNTPVKAIAAGIGLSLSIEIVQLLFFDRVTDIDDLILNSIGYVVGYGVYRLFCGILKRAKRIA